MTRPLPATLAIALLACGSPDPVDDTPAPEVDTTAPTIVSVSPANGDDGVAPDSNIVVQFSETMNTESVEASLELGNVGAASLTWNQASDTLTIEPEAPFDVATGPLDAPPSPTLVTLTVGADASDESGNPLGTAFDAQFSIVRELWGVLRPVDTLTRSVTASAVAFPIDDPLVVGDTADNRAYRAAISFDRTELPDTPTAFVAAILSTEQLADEHVGTPFDGLGTLTLDHVVYDALDSESAINAAFNASQQSTATFTGIASAPSHTEIDVDVIDAISADHTEGEDLSQFLLYFDGFTNLDDSTDRALLSRDELRLEVTYRVP